MADEYAQAMARIGRVLVRGAESPNRAELVLQSAGALMALADIPRAPITARDAMGEPVQRPPKPPRPSPLGAPKREGIF